MAMKSTLNNIISNSLVCYDRWALLRCSRSMSDHYSLSFIVRWCHEITSPKFSRERELGNYYRRRFFFPKENNSSISVQTVRIFSSFMVSVQAVLIDILNNYKLWTWTKFRNPKKIHLITSTYPSKHVGKQVGKDLQLRTILLILFNPGKGIPELWSTYRNENTSKGFIIY